MRLRIAHIAPVATTIPPLKSGSVETMTSLLTEGLVARGHDVTLYATADSKTSARLKAIYPHGYWHDENMWPWELYEMLNLAAAVERSSEYDIIHYEAAYYPMSLAFSRLSPTPIVQTLHHSPSTEEVRLWNRYPDAPFVAIVNYFEPLELATGSRRGDEFLAWIVRMHFGRYGGMGVRVTYVILGLLPAALFVTGAIMWWNRVLREIFVRGARKTAIR